MGAPKTVACHGCGAAVPDVAGPTHRYIGASPGCWAIYGEVLVREHGQPGRPPEHRLVVDAYAAQHPGHESLQSIRSVAVHLIALHLVLEESLPLAQLSQVLQRYSKRPEYRWLVPPADLGTLTIVDLQATRLGRDYARACVRWAESVWSAWSEHHATVRSWARA